MLVRALCIFGSCAFAAVPNIFESGKPAFAKHVNENFQHSENRIDSIIATIKDDSTEKLIKTEIEKFSTTSDAKYVNYGYNQKVIAGLIARGISVASGNADDPSVEIGQTNIKITSSSTTGLFMGVDEVGQYSIGPWKFNRGTGCTPYITFGSQFLEFPVSAVFNNDLIARSPNMVISGTTFQSLQSIPKLDSLESFITTNKNLPGMPDKLDVASDGVNLITLNKILVKKIEELTLYIIEQDKRIKALEAKP
mgnify:CR=1 FL=1